MVTPLMAAARLGRQGVMSFLLQDEMMTTAYPNLLQRTVGLNHPLSPEDGIRKVASAPVLPFTSVLGLVSHPKTLLAAHCTQDGEGRNVLHHLVQCPALRPDAFLHYWQVGGGIGRLLGPVARTTYL